MNGVAKFFSYMEALIHAVQQYCLEIIPISIYTLGDLGDLVRYLGLFNNIIGV